MRRSDREITEEREIDKVIGECKICRLGFCDRGRAYIVPMNFGFKKENGKRILYFHSAKEGKKIDLAKTGSLIGFEMDTGFILQEGPKACNFSAKYKSVIGSGRIEIIHDPKEKEEALQELMLAASGRRNWEFSPQALEQVCALKVTVEEISCKEHK